MESIRIEDKKYKSKKSLRAYVSWVGPKKVKPRIELQLLRNGCYHDSSIELCNGEISCTWENLEVYDSYGDEYVYKVIQLTKLEDYSTEISKYGLLIINRYKKN